MSSVESQVSSPLESQGVSISTDVSANVPANVSVIGDVSLGQTYPINPVYEVNFEDTSLCMPEGI